MKLYKLLITMLFLSTQVYIFPGGEEEFELQEFTGVPVRTKEGYIYRISAKALEQSKTLKEMMQDLNQGGSIPLGEITDRQFSLIKPFLYNPQKELSQDVNELTELARITNYLAIEPLLGRIVKKLAEVLPANFEKFSARENWIEELGLPDEILDMLLKQESFVNSDEINILVVFVTLAYYLDDENFLDKAIKKLAEALIQPKNIEEFLSNQDWVKRMVLSEAVLSKLAQEILFSHPQFIKNFLEKMEIVNNVLRGHESGVLCVAITPDGKKIVSGSRDKTIRIWDLETGKELKVLSGHTDAVYSVAITPNGKQIVSAGSGDKTVRIWDLDTGQQLKVLEGHAAAVLFVAITPDGKKIVSGSSDETAKIWDLKTGLQLKILKGHTDSVNSIAITADERKIISGSDDETIVIWDFALDQQEEIYVLEGHDGKIYSVAITPDGKKIVSGSSNKIIRVWYREIGSLVFDDYILEGHNGPVHSIALTPDWKKIVSGSADKTIRIWDIAEQLLFENCILEGHDGPVYSVAITPDGNKIVSGSNDKTIRIWDMKKIMYLYKKLEKPLEQVLLLAALSQVKTLDYKKNKYLLEIINYFDPEVQQIIFKKYSPSQYQALTGLLSMKK